MANETPEPFDSVAWEANERKERAAFEAAQKEREQTYERLIQLASDLGGDCAPNRAFRGIEFGNKDDADAFKTLCKENGLEVVVIPPDPPRKHYRELKQGYIVCPTKKEN